MTLHSSRRMMLEVLESRNLLDASSLTPIAPNLTPSGPAANSATWEQVVVSFVEGVANPRGAAELLVSRAAGRVGHVYEHALQGFSAQLPPQAVEALARNPVIAIVEPDIVMQTTSQMIPTGVARIQAHTNTIGGTIGQGKQVDVGIAIIDTGIASHPDLNIAGGRHFYTVTSGPPGQRGARQDNNFQDNHGHGTHVAGIAAAKDNDFGVVGVAPGAPLYAVKVLGDNGFGNTSDIIAGVDWVTQNRSVIQVANMSLGGTGWSTVYHTAIQNSVAAGIVYVVAAGNTGGDIHGSDGVFGTNDDIIPAAFPEVATISGFNPVSNAWYTPSSLSNSDDTQPTDNGRNHVFLEANPVYSPGLGIDLVLPGQNIYSTYLDEGYATMSGTSMAAPHAAGLAALYIYDLHEDSRAEDAEGVFAIRQALINQGVPWDSPTGGLNDTWSPDRNKENVGWAGVWVPDKVEIVLVNPKIAGTEIKLEAEVTLLGNDYEIIRVEFMRNLTRIGEVLQQDPESNTWSLDWDISEVPEGDYSLAAVVSVRDSTKEWPNNSFRRFDTVRVPITKNNAEPPPDEEPPPGDDDDPPAKSIDATLTGNAVEVNRNFWRAVATVEVQAAGHSLAGAVVSGQWSNGSTFSGITGSNGQVTFNSSNLNRNTSSINFMVLQIERDGYTYEGPQEIRIYSSGAVEPLSTSLVSLPDTLQQDPALGSGEGEASLFAASVDLLMATLA